MLAPCVTSCFFPLLKYDSRKHSAIRCTRLSRCRSTHRASTASKLQHSVFRRTMPALAYVTNPNAALIPVLCVTAHGPAANRTESHARSRGIARNPPRNPYCRTPAILPAMEIHPHVPAPCSARSTRIPAEAAPHEASPFSNLSTGIKNGQATDHPPQNMNVKDCSILLTRTNASQSKASTPMTAKVQFVVISF